MDDVLILGDYKLARVANPLLERNYRVHVWSPQPPPDSLRARLRWHRRSGEITAKAVCAIVRRVDPVVILPNIDALTEEQALLEYASVADDRWCVHPPAFAQICSDKVALHQFCVDSGIRIPPGRVCASAGSVLEFARSCGPVVIKQARSLSRQGVWHCPTVGAVHGVLPLLRYPVLVQECLHGEELAVEVVSGPHGHTVFPVLSSGTLDGALEPQCRLRTIPRRLGPALDAELSHLLGGLSRLRPNGAWQLDLAISAGHIFLIEVNGRLGGISDLARAVTGVDPHDTYVLAALGLPVEQPRPRRMAIAVPLVPDSQVERPQGWPGEFQLEHCGDALPCSRITATAPHSADLLGLIEGIDPNVLLTRAAVARSMIAAGYR